MSFFQHLNLARLIIIFSLLGSCYLAWSGMKTSEELGGLRGIFDKQVPKVCTEIQELSLLNTKLFGDVKGDKLLGQDSPESYVRGCADNPGVQIGEIDMNPRNKPGQGGVIDKVTNIRPNNRKRKFTHYKIAQFMYRLEADSRQVKVTSIKMDLVGGNKDLDKIPGDEWTFDIDVTNRVKVGGESKRPNAGR